MSDSSNPYQSPIAEAKLAEDAASSGLSATSRGYLKEASPWLSFMGILGFVGAGFMAFVGLIMMIVMPFIPKADLGSSSWASGLIGGIGILYIAIGVLYFFPARFMYSFGAKLRDFGQSGADTDLELALRNNKSYWKFQGIMMIVLLALIPVAIIVSIVIGVASIAH
jgi:hypothetical protein